MFLNNRTIFSICCRCAYRLFMDGIFQFMNCRMSELTVWSIIKGIKKTATFPGQFLYEFEL